MVELGAIVVNALLAAVKAVAGPPTAAMTLCMVVSSFGADIPPYAARVAAVVAVVANRLRFTRGMSGVGLCNAVPAVLLVVVLAAVVVKSNTVLRIVVARVVVAVVVAATVVVVVFGASVVFKKVGIGA